MTLGRMGLIFITVALIMIPIDTIILLLVGPLIPMRFSSVASSMIVGGIGLIMMAIDKFGKV